MMCTVQLHAGANETPRAEGRKLEKLPRYDSISTWFAIGGEGYGTLDAARMHGSGTMPW